MAAGHGRAGPYPRKDPPWPGFKDLTDDAGWGGQRYPQTLPDGLHDRTTCFAPANLFPSVENSEFPGNRFMLRLMFFRTRGNCPVVVVAMVAAPMTEILVTKET